VEDAPGSWLVLLPSERFPENARLPILSLIRNDGAPVACLGMRCNDQGVESVGGVQVHVS
jgi:hypothetical protein